MDNVQSDPSSSNITKLTSDILWAVFQLNTDVFYDETTTQNLHNASQVCQAWRDTVINSPSLWGQVINLNKLLPQPRTRHPIGLQEVVRYSQRDNYLDGHPWLKEIFRRSGASTLCIRADRIMGVENILLALRLIDNEWIRIKKLVLAVDATKKINITDWNPLCRWAPSLESLHLSIINYKRDTSAIIAVPSEDNVPALVHLVAGKRVNLNPRLPWLGHLRYLHISYSLSVPDILDIVDKLSSIQTLQVDGVQKMQDSDASFPIIHPSGLKMLKLVDIELQTASKLLDHIHLPSDCSSEVTAWTAWHMHGNDAMAETMKTVLRPFSKYAQQFYNIYRPTTAKIGQFEDQADDPPYEFLARSPDGFSHFRFSFQMHSSCVDSFVSAFSFPELSCVTELFFLSSIVPDSAANLFLPLMPNVTALEANESIFVESFNPRFKIDYYSDVLDRPITDTAVIPTILPLLSTLRIDCLDLSTITGPKLLCRVIRDLWKKGRPIKVLDLTKNSPGMAPDLSMLEEVSGLKVIWKHPQSGIREYTCGSGEPYKLPYGRESDFGLTFMDVLFGRSSGGRS